MEKEEIKKILETECSIPKSYCELSKDEIDKIEKIICTKLNLPIRAASNLFEAYREFKSAKYFYDYTRKQWVKDTIGTYDYSDNFKATREELERAQRNKKINGL